MSKFFKWMEKKEYIDYYPDKAGCDIYFTDLDYWTNEKNIPKQMLMGYKIEYLFSLKEHFIIRDIINYHRDIDIIDEQLNHVIDDIEREKKKNGRKKIG